MEETPLPLQQEGRNREGCRQRQSGLEVKKFSSNFSVFYLICETAVITITVMEVVAGVIMILCLSY